MHEKLTYFKALNAIDEIRENNILLVVNLRISRCRCASLLKFKINIINVTADKNATIITYTNAPLRKKKLKKQIEKACNSDMYTSRYLYSFTSIAFYS